MEDIEEEEVIVVPDCSHPVLVDLYEGKFLDRATCWLYCPSCGAFVEVSREG